MATEWSVEAAGTSTLVLEPAAVSPEMLEASRRRLVDENIGWLRGWLRGRLKDRDAADDLCQEAFLKAFQRIHELQDPDRFPAWLYRIAVNTLRDHLRTEARRRARIVLTDRLEGMEIPARESTPEVGGEEEAEKVLEAIRALPPRLRDPLILRHTRNLSYREIGRILGIRENAVQVRIFRARRKLRETLKDR